MDDLYAPFAGHEPVALAHAASVGADLFQEQVRVVHESGGRPPGGEPVVADGKGGAAHKGGPGGRPFGCAHVGQVPSGGQVGAEVGVVGQDGSPCDRARGGDGPAVRPAPQVDRGMEEGQILGQPVSRQPSRGAGRRGHRLPLGVGGVEGGQRLGAILLQDLESGQFAVPVGGQAEGHQLERAQGVGRAVGGGLGAQEGELVGRLPAAELPPIVHPARVDLQRPAVLLVEAGQLLLGGAIGAHAPREAVHGQGIRSDQLGQRAAHDAGQHLQLEGAVLSVAETEAVPGVLVTLGLDVRDGVPVAADGHRLPDAGDL